MMPDRPLIEINVPETDGWQDNLAGRLMLVLTGLLLFRMGFSVWASLMPEFILGGAVTILLFATGVQLLILAAAGIDLERWGPTIGYAVLAVVFVAMLFALYRGWLDKIQTDALLFSRASVEGMLAGQNPYTMDMTSWIRSWRGVQFSTPTVDGGFVSSVSYPGGAILWFLPQFTLVGETPWGIRLTLVIGALATGGVVTASLPPRLAVAGPASLFAARNLAKTAAGGVLWPIWVLPTALAMRDWVSGRWLRAGMWLGLAAGSKQIIWAAAPFLLVWGLREQRVNLDRVAAAAAAGFAALNLPFILWNWQAWLSGAIRPVSSGADLVFQGVGVAILPVLGVQIARWWFLLAVGTVVAVSLTLYCLYFDRVKWVAWVLPPAILLFHSRSLTSYFVSFAPLAILAVTAHMGRVRAERVPVLAGAPRPRRPRWLGGQADD
jgi:uncharacterized membrane protein